jgi:hypothetical protein
MTLVLREGADKKTGEYRVLNDTMDDSPSL